MAATVVVLLIVDYHHHLNSDRPRPHEVQKCSNIHRTMATSDEVCTVRCVLGIVLDLLITCIQARWRAVLFSMHRNLSAQRYA